MAVIVPRRRLCIREQVYPPARSAKLGIRMMTSITFIVRGWDHIIVMSIIVYVMRHRSLEFDESMEEMPHHGCRAGSGSSPRLSRLRPRAELQEKNDHHTEHEGSTCRRRPPPSIHPRQWTFASVAHSPQSTQRPSSPAGRGLQHLRFEQTLGPVRCIRVVHAQLMKWPAQLRRTSRVCTIRALPFVST